MRTRRDAALALLVAAMAASLALAQEDPQRGRFRGMRDALAMRRFPAMQGTRRATDTVSQLGEAIPAVREELARHRQAMMDVLKAHLSLANEIDRALRELREAGADEEELAGAVRAWIQSESIEVLNVAGPRQSKTPWIAARAARLLRFLLSG